MDDDLRKHLILVHHHREMWKAVTGAVQEQAGDTPATWMNHYTRLYIDGQAMALRRLIRSAGPNTITLGKLLESIEANAELLTRDAVVARWLQEHDEEHWADYAGRAYDSQWNDGQGRLDLGRLRHDKADLNAVASGIVALADTSIAHITDGLAPTVTFGELDKAIDHTGELFQRYAALITGTHYMLDPVVQDDWQSTFYRPLFPPPAWWQPGI